MRTSSTSECESTTTPHCQQLPALQRGLHAASSDEGYTPAVLLRVTGPRHAPTHWFAQAFTGSSRSARRQLRQQRQQCTAMEESAVGRSSASMDELKA